MTVTPIARPRSLPFVPAATDRLADGPTVLLIRAIPLGTQGFNDDLASTAGRAADAVVGVIDGEMIDDVHIRMARRVPARPGAPA